MIYRLRTLAPEETHRLRRLVSADGRTDLPTMEHPLDDAPSSWHLGAEDENGLVIATASFYELPLPAYPDARRAVRLQFMAVDPLMQRRGVGSAVLAQALLRLRANGWPLVWTTARDTALPFYRRFGFTIVWWSGGPDHPNAKIPVHHCLVVPRSP